MFREQFKKMINQFSKCERYCSGNTKRSLSFPIQFFHPWKKAYFFCSLNQFQIIIITRTLGVIWLWPCLWAHSLAVCLKNVKKSPEAWHGRLCYSGNDWTVCDVNVTWCCEMIFHLCDSAHLWKHVTLTPPPFEVNNINTQPQLFLYRF